MSFLDRLRRLVRGRPTEDAREPELPSAEELFTAEVEAALREVPAVTEVTRGDEFSLVVGGDHGKHTLFLQNVFAETRDMPPADRAARIRRFISIVRDPPDKKLSFAAARERLVPLLRNATMFQEFESEGTRINVRRSFLPFLVECVGIDADDSIGYLTQSELEEWKVDAGAAFRAAHETAAAAFSAGDVRPYGSEPGFALWHVAKDDSYESSRLLMPGWLADFAGRVSGRPVAIVPSRSRVIVGGDGDEACLRALIDAAKREYLASPRSISPALYTVDGGGTVVPLVLPAGHPLAAEVALGHVSLAANEYKIQQDLLQQKLGDGVFVASYEATRKGELVSSYTTWAKDVPSLLPEVADIVMGSSGADRLIVPWQLALSLAGDALRREPGLDPPRWRTVHWPDEATVARLRAAAK